MKRILFFVFFILFAKILLPLDVSKADGTVWAWGWNVAGQLGDGINTDSNIPVPVLNLSNIIEISAGFEHSLALKNDGTVWAWGWNKYGQLGNGTNSDTNVPVQVLNLTNVIAISAGDNHSLALMDDGTVWAWGENFDGQLGNGSWDDSDVPVKVLNLTNIIAISSGGEHSLALKGDGTVWAWGLNDYGQLGSGTNDVWVNVPVQVPDLTNVISISAGLGHSLALKGDGTVWAWGANWSGQLGDGTDKFMWPFPVKVLNLSNVVAISAGREHSLALRQDGTVWAWGYNWHGELGNGMDYGKSNMPVQVLNLQNAIEISAGGKHSLALKEDGTVWAWGLNTNGQLGNGTNSNSNVPVQVSNLTNVMSISAGNYHSLAIVSSEDFLVPAGAHSRGAYGSYWKTDLSICNFSTSDQNINIALLKAGQDNTNAENFDITIGANSCAGFNDIFFEKFSYEGTGALRVSSDTNKLKIKSRTYNASEEGTYGQFIPSIHKINLIKKGETGYLTFLQKNENFRTNLGFSSLSEIEIEINLKLYNSGGEKVGEKDIYLEPYGYRQENDIFEQIGINNISYAYATVSSSTEGAYFTSYASVIDNRSNDPIFIPVEK